MASRFNRCKSKISAITKFKERITNPPHKINFIRKAIDFENFPVHQLGFSVPNVERIISLAVQRGGRQEGEIIENDQGTKAAIRDPDGNPVELYSEGMKPS